VTSSATGWNERDGRQEAQQAVQQKGFKEKSGDFGQAAQCRAETAARHGRDVGLYRRVAVTLRDLRLPPERSVTLPGWKRDLGRRLDALITRAVPGVQKAVKWNSPFYGAGSEDGKKTWFLSFHCFAKYVKVAFFRGAALRPLPPGESKQKDVRYLDIYEDQFDEAQFTAWVKQASELPGLRM
jgi:hypothetical protein